MAAPTARITGTQAELLLHLRITALTLCRRGNDARATAEALAALAAPAYALPAPPSNRGDDGGDGWDGWMRVVAAVTTAPKEGFWSSLTPLLSDERFTDAALSLCVPVCAALAHAQHRKWQQLQQQLGASRAAALPQSAVVPNALLRHCTALLLSAACADAPRGGVAAARTARVLRVLTDCCCCSAAAPLAHGWRTPGRR
jgi:hypothetical protein